MILPYGAHTHTQDMNHSLIKDKQASSPLHFPFTSCKEEEEKSEEPADEIDGEEAQMAVVALHQRAQRIERIEMFRQYPS